MQENKKSIIVIIIAVLIIAIASSLIYVKIIRKPTNQNGNTTNEPNKTNVESNKTSVELYPVVSVEDLNTKINTLEFTNKTTARAGDDDNIPISIAIENNTVKVNFENKNISYSLDVKNPISVGAGLSVQGDGIAYFYILTSDGNVYSLKDYINEVNEGYTGRLFSMGVNNAVSISVVDQNFALAENAQTTIPTVYIKTKDGKVLTDEIGLLTESSLVEVTEK